MVGPGRAGLAKFWVGCMVPRPFVGGGGGRQVRMAFQGSGRACRPRYAVVPPFGAMLAFGEHKGYGMAIASELLGGALTGGGTWHYEESSKQRVLNGMFTIVLDPRQLGTAAAFEREARLFLDWLRKSRPAPGFDRVRIAGEPEREMRERRSRDGIPVDEATWNEIVSAADKLELARSRVEALARGG